MIHDRVCAIANSRSWVADPRGIDLSSWRESLKQSSQQTDIQSLFDLIDELRFTEAAVVDCTASEAIVEAYSTFVELGAHVITPNKKVHLLPWQAYQLLFSALA